MEGSREALIAALEAAVEVTLPAMAATGPGWPVRLNHCFRRVIYDAVAGEPWRQRWPAPAVAHIGSAELAEAVRLAEAMLREGPARCRDLNARSLAARRANPGGQLKLL